MDIKLKASQWFKAGDHPRVEACPLTVIRRGVGGYISGIYPFMNAWVEWERQTIKPAAPAQNGFTGDVAEFWDDYAEGGSRNMHWRRVWLFSMWKLPRPQTEEPISADSEFYKDCRMVEESLHGCIGRGKLEPWAMCGTLTGPTGEYAGRNVVPGSWIVDMPDDKCIIVGAHEFEKLYGKQGA